MVDVITTARPFPPTKNGNPIIIFQSADSRAINLGYIDATRSIFVPGRLVFGHLRSQFTYHATIQSLRLAQIKKIVNSYLPQKISTITVLRETLSCRLQDALAEVKITNYYGDAFIGATHVKGDGPIRTAYLYENIEGLVPDGLWIIGESFCTGRNLYATLTSLLKKFTPQEILFIAPIASRRAINYIDDVIQTKKIKTTYVTWGGLFGVDEKTLYDMPWGRADTEPYDVRDQETFVKMYSGKLCMGGDFGNNYYGPVRAEALYEEQLKELAIKPNIPAVKDLWKVYKRGEIAEI